jgi:acetoin:2,6-dichlorophenolindophenol oxidoreductase subunit alpha
MSSNEVPLAALYPPLVGSRMAEQAITDLARRGVLPLHHSGMGHEAIGVGVGAAMQPQDCAQLSHRSGMMLAHARGACTLREAILAKFGRAPNCFAQIEGRARTLLNVGLVGSGIPMAVGVAMADRLRSKDAVTVAFFGDGAANEGAVHEAMNLAGARSLPIVFIVENNGMAISMRGSESTAASTLAARAAGYGMPGHTVDGQDVVAVYQAGTDALLRARSGDGPTLLETRIERWESHAVGFADLRSADEIAAARAQDGVARLRDRLTASGAASESELIAVEARCRREVDDAVEEAVRLGFDIAEPPPYTSADARRLTLAP